MLQGALSFMALGDPFVAHLVYKSVLGGCSAHVRLECMFLVGAPRSHRIVKPMLVCRNFCCCLVLRS